jgi:glycosyltransferase involved in cell wall biosynthesis
VIEPETTRPAPRYNILYLAGIDLSLHQGHAVHVRRLCEALAERGHRIQLLCHRPAEALDWTAASVSVRTVAPLPLSRLRHPSAEWRLGRALRQMMAAHRPDLVLVRQELFTVAPLVAGRRRNGPLLVAESNSSLPGVAGIGGASRWRCRLAGRFEGRLLRAADAVGVVSPRLAQVQIDSHALDPDRVAVIPNGAWLSPPIDEKQVRSQRDARGISEQTFLIGYVGSLNYGQGLETILHALARGPAASMRFWVVGQGPREAAYRRMITELGLEGRVELLGGQGEAEAARLARAAQVLVAPYPRALMEASYGDALKVLFALACNRPVLCSRLPELDVVEKLRAGEAVPEGDVEAWSVALASWAGRWREAGCPLSRWPWAEDEGPGRRYIRRERTWDHTAATWERLFGRAREAAARLRIRS